ncbi:MAG: glycosyl transferase, group 1 [Acidobacteria bacterium]|nr:glycosyl transferase, group 1 [Acidobacteriota bacterium]
MRIALLSPLPPAQTGIAHYASMVLPGLRERLGVTAVGSPEAYDASAFDLAIYQLGYNPHHEWIYTAAMQRPVVVVLHDIVLHHLIVEMTLARGDADGYIETLRASHGEAGAAWARGRAAGLHSEMGNFLLPASVDLANRSRGVIVHNHYAAGRLRSFGVRTPIAVVPHPYLPEPALHDRQAVRSRLGFQDGDRVIGLFGFLTSAKRGEIVMEAFAAARKRDARIKLLIVGQPAPNIDVAALAGEGVVVTGYVADDEFGAYFAAADRLVNLRYPSAGETSGTLIRAFDAGKPVAVSDYAQFAELPDSCVVKIPFGAGEAEALAELFLATLDNEAIARAQRAWLEANARLELTLVGYAAAVASAETQPPAAPGQPITYALPLFARLELLAATLQRTGAVTRTLQLRVRNVGEATLRTRTYGQPRYRLLVKLFDGTRQVQDRWLELPGDLRPGQETEVSMAVSAEGSPLTVRLHDAIEGIPLLEPEVWATAEVGG